MGLFGYNLFFLKLKIDCSEIIFKCVNSIVRPFLMKKLLKSIIYEICEQCTSALFIIEKSNVTAEKKKKKRSVNKRKRSFQPNLNGHTMLTVSLVKQKTRRPLIIYQEARGPLKRTPKKKKKKFESKNTNYTM